MTYASGKHAWGISDRSGRRYRLRDMMVEWTGAKVGPDEFDPKQPQLSAPKVGPDPQALKGPRPEPNLAEQRNIQYGFNPVGFNSIPGITPLSNLAPVGAIGTVTVTGVINPDVSANIAYPTLVALTSSVGTATSTAPEAENKAYPTLVALTSSVGAVSTTTTSDITATYAVTVASYYGANYYYIDGSRAATLNLSEGSIYRFAQSDSSNNNHPLRFSTTSDGTHGGGSEYTTGVTTNGTPGSAGAYTQIEVASGAPTLYYYCTNHSGMGGQINT